MNELQKEIWEQVQADHEYVVGLRRYFHQHPELPTEEVETQTKIEEELDKLGIEHKRIAGTGVYAEIRGELAGDKTIVLRADIDALPIREETTLPFSSLYDGKMHACGHDAHNAGLLGAARILHQNRDKFGGCVRLTWQPGEEIGYGARIIVDEGVIDGCDRCFGLHLASDLEVGKVAFVPGPNNASVDWFRIKVHGLGAHVSQPERGVDAAYIVSQIVVGAQSVATRQTNPMQNVLIGIGKIQAGTAYNVVAQEGELEGTIRTLDPEVRKATKRKLETLAQQTAAIYGGSVELEWKDYTSPLINDEASAIEAQKTAAGLLGAEKVITKRTPSLGGDDMAEYILKVPGVYGYVGCADPANPNSSVALHNCHLEIDERCLLLSVALYSLYAVEFLQGLN